MTPEAMKEREAIVAHLLFLSRECYEYARDDEATILEIAAEDIRNGDHITETGE